MFRTLFRIIFGFVLACLAAGLVTVLFVITPLELVGLEDDALAQRLGEVGMLTLATATHFAVFAAVFALVAAIIGEWQSLRGPGYYALAGIVITLLGFLAQFSSEAEGQATIVNNYAMTAFVAAGFVAGLVYWFFAGKHAGRPPGLPPAAQEESEEEDEAPEAKATAAPAKG